MKLFIKPILFFFSIIIHVGVAAQYYCNEPLEISCNHVVNVTLDSDGEALVDYTTFLEGTSHDNCEPIDRKTYKIIIPSTQNGGTSPPSGVANDWLLDCSHFGQTSVDVWVGNVDGNWLTCTVNINVEDKLPPTILCPDDITISCYKDPNNLLTTGQLLVEYTCNDDVKVYFLDKVLIDDCTGYVVERTWVYVNDKGHDLKACIQIITVERSPITEANITWPKDTAVYNCKLSTKDLAPSTISGQPLIDFELCSDIKIGHYDKVYKTCENEFTVIRYWTVIDWCSGSVFQYKQEIVLSCARPPVAICRSQLFATITKDRTIIFANDFENGSYDLCGLDLTFSISLDGLLFKEKLVLTCPNLGSYKVILKVENEAGLVDFCQTELLVHDPFGYCKVTPMIESVSDEKSNNTETSKLLKEPTFRSISNLAKVYPNPTSDVLIIEMTAISNEARIKIFDDLARHS